MRHFLFTLTSLFLFPLSLLAAGQQVVDIDIEGMSCKFCAHSVQKNITKLPYVEKAIVNIETKKAHIVIVQGKEANIDQLKKKITGSGFTPVKVTISTLN
ncbi:MAG: heavy metal-associated domain-containing protein [Woeseiaceae bacterium]